MPPLLFLFPPHRHGHAPKNRKTTAAEYAALQSAQQLCPPAETAKLLDYQGREQELLASPNPLAAVVLAHLKVLETRRKPDERFHWKVRVVQGLYDRGLSKDDVQKLFRLIDWMVQLPKELEDDFWQEMVTFEEGRKMPYVTSIERVALEKERQEGLKEGLALGLEVKFGAAGKKLLPQIQAVQDVKKLRALTRTLHSAETLAEVKQMLD